MNLICIVLVACTALSRAEDGTARVSCEVAESECAAVDTDEESAFRFWCSETLTCVEMSRRIFILRRMVPPDETHL